MRKQIGTIQITRPRIYKLDPWAGDDFNPATVVVQPGEYPVYEDGISRYWRMTGVLNHQFKRLGDGMFAFGAQDVPSDDDVVFYSLRYGPDEWKELVDGFAGDVDPALIFTLTANDDDPIVHASPEERVLAGMRSAHSDGQGEWLGLTIVAEYAGMQDGQAGHVLDGLVHAGRVLRKGRRGVIYQIVPDARKAVR